MIFQLGKEDKIANVTRPSISDLNASSLAQIAQSVASSGQLVNILDPNAWIAEHPEVTIDDEVKQAQVILSMPIINGQKNVIGVVQLINKVCILSRVQFRYTTMPAINYVWSTKKNIRIATRRKKNQ